MSTCYHHAMLMALFRTMRPRQWTKNGFIFAALVFDRQLTRPGPFAVTLAGFVILCLASSAVYLVNDLADLESDRRHPTKCFRPLAAGELSPSVARTAAIVLILASLAASLALSWAFALIVLGFLVLNLLYSFRLKHVAIIDVFSIAGGFVLRVAAGVSLITVERFSPWLFVCTTLLALFIGFGKRRAELSLMQAEAASHRRVLDGYTIGYLDQLIMIVSSTTIIGYALYTFSAVNLPENHLMMLTIPFVLYGIFRYLNLIHVENEGGAPEDLLLRDRPLMATLILWGLTSVLILYLG
jgi:4-hydroxybenzoate polyprenyltransferase